MKSIKLSFMAMMLLASTAFVACKKDKKDDAPAAGLSFKADGTLVNTANAKGVLQKTDVVSTLSITGGVESGAAAWGLLVTFPDNQVKAGTFDATKASIIYSGGVADNAMSSAFEGGGPVTVVVTKVDDHGAEGTFSGTVVNVADPTRKKVLTDGRFSVKY